MTESMITAKVRGFVRKPVSEDNPQFKKRDKFEKIPNESEISKTKKKKTREVKAFTQKKIMKARNNLEQER